MIRNRSMPPGAVIPELPYGNVPEAAQWLCRVLGFRERLRIANHRIQLTFGDSAIVVVERRGDVTGHRTMLAVEDAQAHYEHAKREGAIVASPPTDHPYGERQYSILDLEGHHWILSQSIADSDPASWGGVLIEG